MTPCWRDPNDYGVKQPCVQPPLDAAGVGADLLRATKSGEPAMSIVRYAVIKDNAKWRVNLEGVNYGYYDDAAAATRVAIATAQKAGLSGRAAQVLVETLPMQFRVAWTYGVDDLPADA